MSKANIFRKGNAEKNSTEKPTITEKALMMMPLPVVVSVVFIASGKVFPSPVSVLSLQNRWMV